MRSPVVDRSGSLRGALVTGVAAAVLARVMDPAGPLGPAFRTAMANLCSDRALEEVWRAVAAIEEEGDRWEALVASASEGESAKGPDVEIRPGWNHDHDLLTPDEAAGMLNLTPTRVRQLCKAGHFVGAHQARRGSPWLIPRLAVLAVKADRTN